MPTYEYRCPAGHVFEKFFPTMHDKRREKCPTCGRPAERLISGGTGLVFKGSGFYTTDYQRAGDKRDEQEKKEGESKTPESPPADSSKKKTTKKKPSGDK